MLPIKYILTENFNLSVPKKCEPLSAASMLPTAITAGASLLGDVGSVLFGQSAQREENQKNRDFALKMWQMNNEYNTPANQRKRLEEAGYSPWADQSSPNGQSVQAATPSTSSLPSFNRPFSGAAELLQHGLQVQANQELQHAEAMDKIYSVLFRAYSEGGQELYDQVRRELSPTLERFKWDSSYRAKKLGLEIDSMSLENAFKEINNKWYDILSSDTHNLNQDTHQLNQDLHNQYLKVLDRIDAEIRELNSRTDLNYAEKSKVLAERIGVLVDNGIKGVNFQVLSSLKDTAIETGKEQLKNLKASTSNVEEDTNLKGTESRLNNERSRTERHKRKHSRLQGPMGIGFDWQGYGD